MRKHQNKIIWAVLLSETSHIFCCALPIIFSTMSLLTGLGVMSTVPAGWVWFHDLMHVYEIPMIVFSAVVLALGWGLFWRAEKADRSEGHCHTEECHHKHGAKRKALTKRILIVASVLFLVNVSVYFGFHRGDEVTMRTHSEHHHETESHQH